MVVRLGGMEWELGMGCWELGGGIMGICSDGGRVDGRRAHAKMLKMEWLR
jgi:hypothetical protein